MKGNGEKKVIRVDLSWIRRVDRRKLLRAGTVALLAVLVLTSTLALTSRARIASKYKSARQAIGEELYNSMYLFCQTFDQVSVPGLDVENYILPQMQMYYYAAKTESKLLGDAFGPSYAVLDRQTMETIENAFNKYSDAFAKENSTDEAQSAMATSVEMLRTIISNRFKGGILVAK